MLTAASPAWAWTAAVHQPTVDQDTPLVIQVDGLDEAPLHEALGLRMGQRQLVRWGETTPEGPHGYVAVEYTAPILRVSLIQPNGHAYDRTIPDVDEQPIRSAAIAVATLVDAVGAGEIEPTRTDVSQPEPEPEPVPEPEPKPEPEPQPEPQPEPDPEPPPERFSLVLSVAPSVGIGLAPTRGPSYLGAGGSLDLLLAMPSGATFGVEARILAARQSGFGIVRARFAVLAGYRLRRGAFDLLTFGRVFVEPWWVRRSGRAAPLVHEEEHSVSRQPLLGMGARVSPGIRLGERERLRVGATLDLDGSLVPDEGGRSVLLSAETDDGSSPFARLGGAELGLGVDLTLWF